MKNRKEETMRNTIFKSYGMLTNEELKEYEKEAITQLNENNQNINDDDVFNFIIADINFNFDWEFENLNKQINNKILCIASLGLWNGRKAGYKIMSDNLRDVLYNIGCDDFYVYVENGNVRAEGYHHDGRNYVEYREIKNSNNIENLLNKIYNNEPISRQLLNYYTRPIGHYIKEIYGF